MEQYLYFLIIFAFLLIFILFIAFVSILIRKHNSNIKTKKIKKFNQYIKNYDIDKDTEKFLNYIADFVNSKEDPRDLLRNNLFFEKVCTRFLNKIPENVQQYWEKIYKNLRKTIPFKEKFPYLKTTRDIKIGTKVIIKISKKKPIYITGIFAENSPFFFTIVFEKKDIEKLFRKNHYYDFFLPKYKDSLYFFRSKILERFKGFVKFEHPEEIQRIQRRRSRRVKTKIFLKFKFQNNNKILNGIMINLSIKGCGVLFSSNPGKNTKGKIIFNISEEELRLDSVIKNVNKLKNNYYYCSIVFTGTSRIEKAKIAKYMRFKS